MTQRNRRPGRPLEETPEAAAAVDDESTVPQLATGGGDGPDAPDFLGPAEVPADRPPTEDLIGDPHGAGSPGSDARTGADQPWEPEDLAAAQGREPNPHNVERAREELERDGPAAVERTVP
nr:hypothetical protein [Micromonospora sp. DSM 115978]